jgi:hypothetical protein
VEILGGYSKRTDVLDKVRRILRLPTDPAAELRDVPDRQRHRRLRPEEQAEVVARYQAGESVYALADAFSIRRQTISATLGRHGVRRRYNLLCDSDVQRARELYESGLSLVDVGAALGVSSKTVLNGFRAAGIETRAVGTNQWNSPGRGA